MIAGIDIETILPLSMFVVLGLALFSGYPVAFVLSGIALAFGGLGLILDLFPSIAFYNIAPRIWGGICDNIVLTAIPLFVFMGTMLEQSGIGNDLLRTLQFMLRRVPGGLALAVTAMGTILAATTGIIGASVVMMTVLALPPMLKSRYNPALAAGTVAASGTLGILIPPSIMLVIIADMMARSVGNLFVAAVFPGLLLVGLYSVYILIACWMKPELAPPAPDLFRTKSTLHLVVLVTVNFVAPALLVFLVLGSILFGWATPTEAASVGAVGALVLSLGWKPAINAVLAPTSFAFEETASTSIAHRPFLDRLLAEWRGGGGMVRNTVKVAAMTNAMVFMIMIGATAFSFVFRLLGGDGVVDSIVEGLGLGSWGLLAAILIVVFLLGFFFDWIEITLIVLPIFTPLLDKLDFGAHVAKPEIVYWFAILMAVNLQTSFLTPPFGFALFYIKGAAPDSVRMQDVYRGIIPFVILQLLGLGLVVAFPDIALWLPRTVLN